MPSTALDDADQHWAADIDPFPAAPTVAFDVNDPELTEAFDPVTFSTANHLCAALVDLTGDPATPPYVGLNDEEMIFAGSLPKICAMYAAFALRAQVQTFVDAAARGRDILLSIRLLKKFEFTTDITRGRDCRCK